MLAEGCPGMAVTLDLEKYRERRNLMLALLECAAGVIPFASWVQASESFSNRKTEKLDLYFKIAYGILEDILMIWQGSAALRNRDISGRISRISEAVNFRWIEKATGLVDELAQLVRRNIQKTIALDAVIIELRNQLQSVRA